MRRKKILILGAAGRDFHDFNVLFRCAPEFHVTAFTATQIPNIEGRTYPPELAGPLYPKGIPIFPESELSHLLQQGMADEVIFAYSDVPHEEVMHKASMALASGADFRLLGPRSTMIAASIPVVSVGAVRTGAGKSQTTRKIAEILRKFGKKTVVVRHPMPYGNLAEQICQRFAVEADLDLHHCTLEEREEYSQHLEQGIVVYAGVDYGKILEAVEREADVLLWDGGNNDFPFYQSDLHVVVADPHRPGHELRYHPGETNFRMADVIIINKTDSASPENVETIKNNIRTANPDAIVVEAESPISGDPKISIQGKKFLAIEDGPTVTHGGMGFGAAYWFGKQQGGIPVNPKPCAVGSLKAVYEKAPHLKEVLPAMGYSEKQREELSETIEAVPCDFVLIGTPVDLRKIIKISKPVIRVRYDLLEKSKPDLQEILGRFLESRREKNSSKLFTKRKTSVSM